MKQNLSPKMLAVVLGSLGVVVVLAAVFYFKDSFAPTPTVTPKAWSPTWSQGGAGAPGAPSDNPAARFEKGAGAPIGAPANPGTGTQTGG